MIRTIRACLLGLYTLALLAFVAIALSQGQPPPSTDATSANGPEAQPSMETLEVGEDLFSRNCAYCHGVNGRGVIGPALASNHNLASQEYVVTRILRGGGGMPAFHSRLTTGQIAAVASYVRTAWDNDYGEVEVAQVATQWWAGAATPAALFDRICARCHGADGGGFIGPALQANPNLSSAQYVVGRVLHGGGGMPAFSGLLSANQIATLASYVRTAWGNSFGPVEVALVRQQNRPGGQAQQGGQSGGAQSGGAPAQGAQLFAQNCAQCHGQKGQGGVGPALAGNQDLKDAQAHIEQILHGGGGMPAFGGKLSSRQIAAVASFERTSWGNSFGKVTAQQVTKLRQGGRHTGGGQAAGGQVSAQGQLTGPALGNGAAVYQANCEICHGSQGQGGVAPALAGNSALKDARYVIARIVMGGGGMVPFNERLSSADIAAVASHVRSSWGNAFGVVTLAQVQDEHAAGPQQAGRQAAPPVQGLSGGGRSTGGSGGGATRAATGGRSGGAARAAGGASAGAPTGGARTGGARSGGAPSGGGRAGGARAPASGALHILVQPSGSRVTVTGPNRYLHYEAGVSREQLTGLTPGRYTVSVTKQGYQAGTQQTTVSPGKTTQVTIELKPLARQTGGGP